MIDYDIKKFSTSKGYLYSGPYPEDSVLERLQKRQFKYIWNLAKELYWLIEVEKKYCKNVIWTPIPDFSIPEDIDVFKQDLNTIVDALKQNEQVFVHCFGGRGRTGMALGCISQLVDNEFPTNALSKVFKHCEGPESEEQKKFVMGFFDT